MIEEFQEDVCGCEYAVTEAKVVSHAYVLKHKIHSSLNQLFSVPSPPLLA